MYWYGIIEDVWKEVTYCDTFQHIKWSKIKYGKLSDKEAEEKLWNKLCVDLTGPYVIRRKGQKDILNLKAATVIDPVKEWSKIAQYDDKIGISIANYVETTLLTKCPRWMEIMYNQGSELIGHEFIKSLIEKITG